MDRARADARAAAMVHTQGRPSTSIADESELLWLAITVDILWVLYRRQPIEVLCR